MKDALSIFSLSFLFFPIASYARPVTITDVSTITLAFSPEDSGEKLLIDTIEKAQSEVLVSAFHFTNTKIADALIRKKEAGIRVVVLLDREHRKAKKSVLAQLEKAGIEVRIDEQHHTAHNKVMIIDQRFVTTGSYNFNSNAEKKNAENLLCIDSIALARQYRKNWLVHYVHATKW